MNKNEHNKALLNHLLKLEDIGRDKLTVGQKLQRRYALGLLRDRNVI